MSQVVDVVSLADHAELQGLAVGGPGEAVADLEMGVVKQAGRRENLAWGRVPAPCDDQIAQPRRVAAEQLRVDRVGHTYDRHILAADRYHACSLWLRVEDPHDVRIRIRAAAVDHDLVVAGAGPAVVDELEA